MNYTTPTSGRPTVHPDWQEPSERIYRALYPGDRTPFSAFDLYPIDESQLAELQACGDELSDREAEFDAWMADMESTSGWQDAEIPDPEGSDPDVDDLRYMPVDAILLQNLGWAGLSDSDGTETPEDWSL